MDVKNRNVGHCRVPHFNRGVLRRRRSVSKCRQFIAIR